MGHTINKTLIIRLSSIGDIILTSLLVRLLRKKFPDAQIDFLVKTEYTELVRYNPHLQNVIELDTSGGFTTLRGLKERIHREGYDTIIDIQGNLRSNFLRKGSSGKVATVNKRKLSRFLLVNFKWNVYRSATPVALRYLETLRAFGIENDGMGLEVFIPEEVSGRVRDKLLSVGLEREETVVGLCPGAKHTTKRWPAERFAKLAVLLIIEHGAKVLLFGGEDDLERCAAIEQQVVKETGKRSSVANFGGAFSLLETAAAMDACDVIVTNDTGLLHLAAARKRKVVAIFGPTVKEFGFFPFRTESKVVERLGLYCRPCTHIGGNACPEGHFRCMKEITIEEVLTGVKSFLTVAA
ncbi:MAG: lipopolysaccharide heptosyltransferase II [Bacteroidota bacterium]